MQPTRGRRPLDSPQLIRDEVQTATGAVQVKQWRVPVLEFDADFAVEVLRELDLDSSAHGASVIHLVELAVFAADLVGRGRLLPGVDSDSPRAEDIHSCSV